MPLRKHIFLILLLVILGSLSFWVARDDFRERPESGTTAPEGTASAPSSGPTALPTETVQPTLTAEATAAITPQPTATVTPTVPAASQPSVKVTPQPTATAKPTVTKAPPPTVAATPKPTVQATPKPTPTVRPTAAATPTVTAVPTTAPPTVTPTTPPTASPTSPPGQLTEAQWIAEVFRLTNVERQKMNLPLLQQPSSALLRAAAIRAEESATLFSHTRPDGTAWHTVLDGISYQTAGENLAWGTTGYLTPQRVVDMWMGSPGHKANILNPAFTSMGVGFYRSVEKNGDFLTQLFLG